jgi:predicted nucleic-acid-binding Zn-ribbon protein
MTKTWECTQCGNRVSKGIIGSVRGAPDTCEYCDNTEFAEPTTLGTAHTFIDRFLG